MKKNETEFAREIAQKEYDIRVVKNAQDIITERSERVRSKSEKNLNVSGFYDS